MGTSQNTRATPQTNTLTRPRAVDQFSTSPTLATKVHVMLRDIVLHKFPYESDIPILAPLFAVTNRPSYNEQVMQPQNRCPLIEEIPWHYSAPETFELFRRRPTPFFLDSGMDPQNLGRYSFMGSDPFLVLKSRGDEICLSYTDREEQRRGNPFDVVAELFQQYSMEKADDPLPFTGGAVGYFSYDLCHFVETLPTTAEDDLLLPESYLAFYDCLLAFDHLENKVYIASTGLPLKGKEQHKRAEQRLQALKKILKDPNQAHAE